MLLSSLKMILHIVRILSGVFRYFGIWKGHSRLIQLIVDGKSFGQYLMCEHPYDTAIRMGGQHVATRNLDDEAIAVGWILLDPTSQTAFLIGTQI